MNALFFTSPACGRGRREAAGEGRVQEFPHRRAALDPSPASGRGEGQCTC
jgi:hypothetical protein